MCETCNEIKGLQERIAAMKDPLQAYALQVYETVKAQLGKDHPDYFQHIGEDKNIPYDTFICSSTDQTIPHKPDRQVEAAVLEIGNKISLEEGKSV